MCNVSTNYQIRNDQIKNESLQKIVCRLPWEKASKKQLVMLGGNYMQHFRYFHAYRNEIRELYKCSRTVCNQALEAATKQKIGYIFECFWLLIELMPVLGGIQNECHNFQKFIFKQRCHMIPARRIILQKKNIRNG